MDHNYSKLGILNGEFLFLHISEKKKKNINNFFKITYFKTETSLMGLMIIQNNNFYASRQELNDISMEY